MIWHSTSYRILLTVHCGRYLDQVGSRHPPLLKVLLPVLLLHLQGKARPQNSLWVRGQIKVMRRATSIVGSQCNKRDLPQAGRRRRLPEEQSWQLGVAPARFEGSCHRTR